MFSWFYILWLGLLPFVGGFGNYEGAKMTWWLWGSVGLLVYWSIQLARGRALTFASSDLWYWIWILALTWASIVGIAPIESIIGGSIRHQGVIFFITIWIAANSYHFLPALMRKWFVYLLAGGVVNQAIILLIQYFFPGGWAVPGLLGGRAVGTFGEPNAAAGYLAIGSIFLLFGSRKKLFLVFWSLLIFAAILATGSRSGLVAYLGVIIIVCLEQIILRTAKGGEKLPRSVAIVFVLLIGVFGSGYYIWQTSRISKASIYESRQVIWPVAARAIAQKPLFGYGAESGEAVFAREYLRQNVWLENLAIDRAHNVILDLLMWSGVIGLASFCMWLIVSAREKFSARRVAAIAAWIFFALLQPVGTVQWILLLLLLYIYPSYSDLQPDRAKR